MQLSGNPTLFSGWTGRLRSLKLISHELNSSYSSHGRHNFANEKLRFDEAGDKSIALLQRNRTIVRDDGRSQLFHRRPVSSTRQRGVHHRSAIGSYEFEEVFSFMPAFAHMVVSLCGQVQGA